MKINIELASKFYSQEEYSHYQEAAINALDTLQKGTGKGNDFLGWLNLPSQTTNALIDSIMESVQQIRTHSKVLVVIGIGGSYLGSKAVISALQSKYYNRTANELGWPELYFAGNDLSGTELTDLIALIGERDFSINIISKSGTTTEPAIAFRILKNLLIKKYGANNIQNRVFATTDSSKGALRTLAASNGWKSYIIPDDVGGRFSVFTPVGLLPIAASGIDIQALIEGAKKAELELNILEPTNPAILYAAVRNTLYNNNKIIEILSNYEPRLSFIAAWWKQLFGESEGKNSKGVFPASADFTCDLHSLGQYIQDGPRHLMQTILTVSEMDTDIDIPSTDDNLDNLNYLSDKSINYVNQKAQEGTLEAHHAGGVPNIIIEIPTLDAFNIGYLLYFFEISCGISAYILNVNPFDQPGVETYKKNMFRLLGKPD